MGLLFTSLDTVKLCARLNRRFSEDNIAEIRDDPDRLKKFDPANNRSLARVAYKSGIHPGKKPANNIAKRWFRFLKDLDGTTSAAIKAALWKGLTTKTGSDYIYQSLVFATFEGGVTRFSPTDLSVLDAAGNDTGRYSMLFTLQTKAIGNLTYDPSGTPDVGETPQEPNDPQPDPDPEPAPAPAPVVTKGTTVRKTLRKKTSKKKG